MAGEIKILKFSEGVIVGPPDVINSSVVIKTNNYTATTSDDYIEINAALNTVTVTLPSAATQTGKIITLKTISMAYQSKVSSADLIDGQTDYIFNVQYESITVISNGTTWRII